DVLFLLSAGLWSLARLDVGSGPLVDWLVRGPGRPLAVVLEGIAVLAALVVIAYPGIVLAASPSIPFWNTMLIPLQFLAMGFASALGLVGLSAAVWAPLAPERVSVLGQATVLLVGVTGLLLCLHLLNGQYGGVGGRASVRRLLRGDLSGVL